MIYFGLGPLAGRIGGCATWPDCGAMFYVVEAAVSGLAFLLPPLLVGLSIGLLQGQLLGRRGTAGRNALILVGGLVVAKGLYVGLDNFVLQLTNFYRTTPFWGALAAALAGGLVVGGGQAWLLRGQTPQTAGRRGGVGWTLSTGLAWLLGGATVAGLEFTLPSPPVEFLLLLVGVSVIAIFTSAAWAWQHTVFNLRPRGLIGLAAGIAVVFVGLTGAEAAYREYRVQQILAQYQRPDWSPAAATPGMTLTLTEMGREGPAGQTQVTYTASVAGLPRDQTYTLWQMPLDGTPVAIDELAFSEAGELVSQRADSRWPSLVVAGYARAQPFSLALTNARETVRVFAKVYPFPVEATGAGGCWMWLELYNARGTNFLAKVTGFVPEEMVYTSSGLDPVEAGGGFTVDQQGAHGFSFWADPDEHYGAHSAFTVTGQNCTVTVEFELGTPAMDPQ